MESKAGKSPPIHRSISMPMKPHHSEPKKLQRSEEKEVLYEKKDDDDYYPESPALQRNCTSSKSADLIFEEGGIGHELGFPTTQSVTHLHFPGGWNGSTIELNADSQTDDLGNSSTCYRSKHQYRLLEKNGTENVNFRNVPEKPWRYIRDFVTTLIELDWKYMLSMFVGSYFFSWFFFAVLCYMVAYSHGDLFFDEVTGERLGEGKDPCIMGVHNFLTMFIYSIETQTTIGFGEKYPSEECAETIFLFIMQIICSIAIEGAMISIIYAKTARPAKQITKMKFSNKAVICYRDGKLCLLFRVCDPRQQQTIESKIRIYMIIDRPTKEGEILKTHTELKLENNGQQIIVWPEVVCHVIDENSPLRFFTSAREFNAAQFELYVSIVGVSPTTAQVTEARTSYLPKEIFWGQRFVNIITYDPTSEGYVIDTENFNTTISVDMHPNIQD